MSNHYTILTLNQISAQGLHRFPAERYEVGKAVESPDAIIVRSADMHGMAIPASVKAIGRAGAGTNNIPVAEMSKRGVPVFNAPGALNTGTPRFDIAATGMLFVPAPARPIALTDAGIVMPCMSCERTRMASGASTDLPKE